MAKPSAGWYVHRAQASSKYNNTKPPPPKKVDEPIPWQKSCRGSSSSSSRRSRSHKAEDEGTEVKLEEAEERIET